MPQPSEPNPTMQLASAQPRVYIAGPQIFMPDFAGYKDQIEKACCAKGLAAAFPADNPGLTAAQIARANLSIIDSCCAIFANLIPFRGLEPDSGTVFELSYALAKGKLASAYGPHAPMADRIDLSSYGPVRRNVSPHWPCVDKDGNGIENFGMPLNLMICSFCKVHSSVEDALDELKSALAA